MYKSKTATPTPTPTEKKNNISLFKETSTPISNNSIKNNKGDSLPSSSNISMKESQSNSMEPEKPLEYPFIEEHTDFIKILIYNPDAGKETDLIYFYDDSYFDLVGLYPEVTISNDIQEVSENIEEVNRQTGGEETNDKTFYEIFMSYISPTKKEDTPPPEQKEDKTIPLEENTTISSKEELNTSILSITPVTPKTIDSPNNSPDNSPIESPIESPTESPIESPTESPDNSPTDSPLANIIVLTFFPNEGIKSFTDVIETRNPELDIDITLAKYKFKELEKIKMIKEKKTLSTDISIKEVYYINGKLIVLKGALNTIENGGANTDTNVVFIDVKTEIANFIPEKEE